MTACFSLPVLKFLFITLHLLQMIQQSQWVLGAAVQDEGLRCSASVGTEWQGRTSSWEIQLFSWVQLSSHIVYSFPYYIYMCVYKNIFIYMYTYTHFGGGIFFFKAKT